MKLIYALVTLMGVYITAAPGDRGIIPCNEGEEGSESGADCTLPSD
jgi:hypothetical protein